MRDIKGTLMYIIKRIVLMLVTLSIIFIIVFTLVRLLPIPESQGAGKDAETFYLTQVKLGRMYKGEDGNYYDVPIIQQLFTFVKNLFYPYYRDETGALQEISRWGYSWEIEKLSTPTQILTKKLPITIFINLLSMLVSVPVGLAIGTYMALKKNKWQDHVLSILVMVVISVPSFVYAFLIQYFYAFKWGLADITRGEWNGTFVDLLRPDMLKFLVMPVLSMCFGSIAGYARYTRAELTEVLTSDFMLLARTKGLSRAQATVRHAFRNSLVPIFPMILGEILSLMSGSMIIESIFTVNGVGSLFLESYQKRDYDVFQFVSVFYIFIGLVGGLLVDISYGLVDPRIRIGGRK